MVADVADLLRSQGRMRAHLHRRAVFRMNHPAADQSADLVGGEVLAGEDAENARRAARGTQVDVLDDRMGVRRADEDRIGLARPADVIDVLPSARDEAEILAAPYRSADARAGHGVISSRAPTLPPDGSRLSSWLRRPPRRP